MFKGDIIKEMLSLMESYRFIFLAGRPETGKSAFAADLAKAIAANQKKVLFCSPRWEKEELYCRYGLNENKFLFIDDTPVPTADQICESCRLYKELDTLLIDDISFVQGTEERGSRLEEISEVFQKLHHLSRELDLRILAMGTVSSHPKTMPEAYELAGNYGNQAIGETDLCAVYHFGAFYTFCPDQLESSKQEKRSDTYDQNLCRR